GSSQEPPPPPGSRGPGGAPRTTCEASRVARGAVGGTLCGGRWPAGSHPGGPALRSTPMKQAGPAQRGHDTYLHRGTRLVGRVEAVGRVRVHGVVEGDVEVDGVVEVAPAGVIVGSLVKAEELRVLGKVRADVVVSGEVEIWNGGELVGDVKAA